MKLKYGHIILSTILCFAFLTRIYRLHIPDRYIFDEVYHVVTAKLVAANDPRAFEWWHAPIEPNTAIDWLHPPLAKYTQGFFIRLFGSSSFSWRISSVLFGVGVIYLTYQLSQELFKNQTISLLAAALAALDGLLLVQSRITMNDIHVTFFILLTFIFYLRYKKNPIPKHMLLTGLGAGLAISTKWSGIFVLFIIWLSETIKWIKKMIRNKKSWNKLVDHGLSMFLCWGLFPFGVYLLSYTQMFLQGKGWTHLTHLHQQIWWYQTNLTATHPYQSQPWQWFFNLKPVWFHVDYLENGLLSNIYAIGNPVFHLVGVITVILSVIFLAINKKTNHKYQLSQLNWLVASYFCLWLPWQISPRIMFYYHYAPAVPLLAIIIAYWLYTLWLIEVKPNQIWNKISVSLIIFFILIAFIAWYPHWTAIPVSTKIVNKLYFLLPSWK